MQRLIELPKDETILVSSEVRKFLHPDLVYLPIGDNELKLYKDAKVCLDDTLFFDMASPVSGNIRNIKEMTSLSTSKYFLEIENDFEEKRAKEAFTKRNLSKKEILNCLALENKDNLVLNAIDDEIYIVTENFYLMLYYEEFLELLDKINEFWDINIYICLKASSSENISKLMDALGTYPHIILKVLPDLYLLAKPEFLLAYLELDEKTTLVIKASYLYQVYNELKRKKEASTQLLTISGNNITERIVVEVKRGTRLKELLNAFYTLEADSVFIANNLLQGISIDLESFVITKELKGILIMRPNKTKQNGACFNCGVCSAICPVGIQPVFLTRPKYLKAVKDKCIKCGLCTYICPVYINFHKYLEGEEYE